MDIYHILKYLVMFFQRNISGIWRNFASSNDQLGKGHNSQLIVLIDYNLLFKGEEQVEICFIAHHEWIAKQWVSEKYRTPKIKGTKPSVV